MPSSNARGVKSDGPPGIQNVETTNSILVRAGAAADGQQGLELLEIAPGPAARFDTEATKPRSKIRVVAVMGALFVSYDSFVTTSPYSVIQNPIPAFVNEQRLPVPCPTFCAKLHFQVAD
jgi:hypothetical protein